MATDKALSLVGPIMDAYNAAEKAGASALGYALECGKHLNAAKATVTGSWKKWREKNLPTVSEETERVYRRLAEAIEKKADVFASCKSIRDALKHLSALDEDLEPKPEVKKPRTTRTGSTAAGLAPPEADTPPTGLKAELENAAADEIIVSIGDADKLEEVAKASLVKLGADKVCDAIIGAFSVSQIADLTKRLNDHVQRQPKATAVPPAPPPDLPRRSFTQPAVS
jgi:hypothetical protein